jgi:hypothetical protein
LGHVDFDDAGSSRPVDAADAGRRLRRRSRRAGDRRLLDDRGRVPATADSSVGAGADSGTGDESAGGDQDRGSLSVHLEVLSCRVDDQFTSRA